MVWNTNDWNTEEEDKHWEMTEDDTDDEYDDIALSRLGVEIPDFAKEERTQQTSIPELIAQWRSLNASPEIIEAFESVMDRSGNIHFGDEPQGIDPIRAGFEGAEEILAEAAPEPHPVPSTLNICEQCGKDDFDCECDLWF